MKRRPSALLQGNLSDWILPIHSTPRKMAETESASPSTLTLPKNLLRFYQLDPDFHHLWLPYWKVDPPKPPGLSLETSMSLHDSGKEGGRSG